MMELPQKNEGHILFSETEGEGIATMQETWWRTADETERYLIGIFTSCPVFQICSSVTSLVLDIAATLLL